MAPLKVVDNLGNLWSNSFDDQRKAMDFRIQLEIRFPQRKIQLVPKHVVWDPIKKEWLPPKSTLKKRYTV
jgi:hypothetical protein